MSSLVLKKILWTLNCWLSLGGCVVVYRWILRSCKQCVLFGDVNEVHRIFTGGSIFWCWFALSGCVVSFITGIIVILGMVWKSRYKNENCAFMNQSRYVLMCKVSLLWTFLAAVVSLAGLIVWCRSFSVNGCSYNASQDWNAFTPKHSDCFGANSWQILLNVFLWGSFFIQTYDYSKSIHATRT